MIHQSASCLQFSHKCVCFCGEVLSPDEEEDMASVCLLSINSFDVMEPFDKNCPCLWQID